MRSVVTFYDKIHSSQARKTNVIAGKAQGISVISLVYISSVKRKFIEV
jgi:hypothetical protein